MRTMYKIAEEAKQNSLAIGEKQIERSRCRKCGNDTFYSGKYDKLQRDIDRCIYCRDIMPLGNDEYIRVS